MIEPIDRSITSSRNSLDVQASISQHRKVEGNRCLCVAMGHRLP